MIALQMVVYKHNNYLVYGGVLVTARVEEIQRIIIIIYCFCNY